ncbi:cob(I)alamin adenosyltransferase [Myxococcaceae bacterium]|nr:cob(I)alamin adenosyltransferase [Myxococcaceae bacterium]
MKIYTRRGDRGETDLFGGERVGKDALRVEAYGAVDELNASLGVASAASRQADVRNLVEELQATLFSLGSYLATPEASHRAKAGIPEPSDSDVEGLEKQIDALEAELPPLARFILPGGSAPAAAFQLARTICRRAERRAVALHRDEPLSEALLRYLNRLSDLLFVLGRIENRREGVREPEWVLRPR